MSPLPPTPKLASFGELLWDLYPDEARLGGAPANVAFHAAAQGAESYLLSRVGGDDLGERALRQLAPSGVRLDYVTRDPELPTGTVQVRFEHGEPRYTIEEPAAWDAIELRPAWLNELSGFDALCFGSLAQRAPTSRSALHALLDSLRAAPRRPLLVFDLNLRPPFVDPTLVLSCLGKADLVKLNEEELTWLEGVLGTRDAVRTLLETRSVRTVALTRGARGAVLFTMEGVIEHPGVPSSGVDPVGAGDAFLATLTVELTRGAPPEDCLARACEYAAWVASQPGAMPRRDC